MSFLNASSNLQTESNSNKLQQSIIEELITIRDFLRWMVSAFENNKLFFGHGTDNSWDEAIALLIFYLKIPADNLGVLLDAKLTWLEKNDLYLLIQTRIQQRMPLPYITKQAWFTDMEFYVDNRVLIPRSPIAELIKNNFQPWLTINKNNLNILEIGTGSGCIACSIAKTFIEQGIENINVDAVDISDDALEVAKINVENHELINYVKLIKSDLFSSLKPNSQYDLIISNPPYVDVEEMTNLPKEFCHEPKLALEAGDDGLDLVRIILSKAYDYLTDDGILIVEVGASKPALEKNYPNVAFLWLDFANGGDGVFLLTKEQLNSCQ